VAAGGVSRLLSTSKQRTSELTDEASSAATATATVATVILLVASHECVHGETAQSASPVACLSVAHASCSVACAWS